VASHGNSGNVLKTAADVVLNATASGIAITRNASTGVITCNGTCHGETHRGRTW